MNSPEIMEPSACTWCGVARRGHGRQYADAVGWHAWEQPSQEQILARMKARRLARVVARVGALPMPVGPEPSDAEDELSGARLSLWEEEQATARLRLALKSAQRGRRELRGDCEFAEGSRQRWRTACLDAEQERDELRARVSELEAERHVTNEALDDAVQELRTPFAERARRETHPGRRQAWLMLARIEESERVYEELTAASVARSADKLTQLLAPTQALQAEGEHYAATHHSYRVGRDLPETGGDRRG